jgi:hypothetical protein
MKKYRVVIPYYYEFEVEASNKKDALHKSHQIDGNMIGYDDDGAIIEEI